MALHQMALFGSTPIGAVLMGWIIQISSPRVPFALGALSAVVCAAAVVRVGARSPGGELAHSGVLPPVLPSG